MLADECFDRGAAVHVGDGNDQLVRAGLLELFPAIQCLIEVGHVSHRATGAEVREDDSDLWPGENVGGLGHEVHAAEDDVLGLGLVGGLSRKFETVAGEVGEIDDGILLIVVSQHYQSASKGLLGGLDSNAQLRL